MRSIEWADGAVSRDLEWPQLFQITHFHILYHLSYLCSE